MPKNAGNSVYLKRYNRALLLGLVREHGSISRTALARLTGLAPKSVYEIAAGLIDDGYLDGGSVGDSNGGRRPAMLSLRRNSFFSIGVDIDVGSLRAVLMELTGGVLFTMDADVPGGTYGDFLDAIEQAVGGIIRRHSIAPDRLLGVGVSVPGFIDRKTGRILMAPNLGWENRDMAADLGRRLGCALFVENEAMATAVCEKWIGCCRDDADFICINIKSGIGAGIFLADKPYTGASGTAGEIGHIPVERNGPLCGCKNRGCLETMCSTRALLSKAAVLYGRPFTLDELIALAEHDGKARGIFTTAADYLALVITGLINALNPSRIVLGKDFVRYSHLMLGEIITRTAATALRHSFSAAAITVSGFAQDDSVLGAAILPVRNVFSPS
ncbi:MAG: ROK family protein [Clostridia bacterium]|nr:ROK family protein [Clostridia bacterium]MDR3645815.1 ROK family protein [Clostridia bacterium]